MQVVEKPRGEHSARSQEQTSGVDSTRGSEATPQSPKPFAPVAAGTLTVAHVFERLRVNGLGEAVMVFVKRGSGTIVKTEALSQGSSGQENARGDPQPDEGAWRVALLVSVSLPDATVEVPDKGGCQRLVINVDKLRATKLPAKLPAKTPDPSLQERGETLDPYDYDLCQVSFSRAVVGHISLWAHLSANACVEGVEVSRRSDKDKLPFILQVRAKQAFKKGTLVLAPAYGELLPKDSDTELQLARSQGVVHAAMLSHVEVEVAAGCGDRRRTAESREPKVTKFVIGSPLLDGKAPKTRQGCMENLAPFWALLRCAGPRADHNMELDSVAFRDGGFDTIANDYPKMRKGVVFTVQMPIARNSSHISQGEVLCLPFVDT